MRERLRVSVRARTTITATTVVAVATIAISFLIVGYLHTKLTEELDKELSTRLATASQVVRNGNHPPFGDASIQVRLTPGGGMEFAKADPADGEQRVAQTSVPTPQGTKTLLASAPTRSVHKAIDAASRALLVGAPMLLIVVAALTWFGTGRALRPVDAIRTEFARLSAHDLRGRMPVPAGSDALARLAVTLNETLDRLDGSVQRQRQFVADASHELRSPLTALRTPLEVALAHPERMHWPDVAAGTLQDLDRLEQLVADLLVLARTDSTTSRQGSLVDLSGLLTEIVHARAAGVPNWDIQIDEAVVIRGHRSHLARLFTNLLDNAERYATDRIQVRLFVEDDHACVEITDDGPGIPAEARQLVFDRFTRLDTSRERMEGGTGLGLALARGVATMHGGTLDLLDSDRGARFATRIPLTTDDTVDGDQNAPSPRET